MNIVTVIGVRPQFVKAACLSPVIRKEHKEILIHTGQHYDDNMSAVFFRELGLPEPDYILDVKQTQEQKILNCQEITAVKPESDLFINDPVRCMMEQLEPIVRYEKADAVLIYGDTNSTLAGALVAKKLKIPAIHVEAGERNGLKDNPEEQIRRRVDEVSSLLLCSTKQAVDNLYKERLGAKTHFIGNLMEISFRKNIEKPWHPHLLPLVQDEKEKIIQTELSERSRSSDRTLISIPKEFYLLTCHRQENANEKCLTEILLGMEEAERPVIYPVHPRNREPVLKICADHKLRNIILTEPVGYFDSIHLIKNAAAVVTDSGGVLQEAHYARTPYVFVMDMPKPPANTRFDVSRLVRPQRQEILRKIGEKQVFATRPEPSEQAVAEFERNVLKILREFEWRGK